METFTNIQEANQRIGALNAQLTTEKEARTAVAADLETAQAAHSTELESLKTAHGEELATLKGEHAKTVTDLTDKLEAATKENETLKAEAKTADEKAADIVSAQGGEPVAPEGDTTEPKTKADIQALWDEHAKLPVGEKRAFYLENIKPHIK